MSKPRDALPIVQYWHSQDVPTDVMRIIETFRSHNPSAPHLLFDKADAEELIAANFTDRELASFRSCAVPAMQSDYFSYCAALVHGGVYADVDLACVGALDTLLGPDDEGMLLCREEGAHPGNNGFFAFAAPDHPLPRLLVEIATENIERQIANHVPWSPAPG